jgi:hypothetical protein
MTDLVALKEKFQRANIKNRLPLVEQFIDEGENGQQFLREFLEASQGKEPNLVLGKAYQLLYKINNNDSKEFLNNCFAEGIVSLKSAKNIDYSELQKLLIEGQYQAADTLTRQKLCELAGEAAIKRKWLYFTEIEKLPATDLELIDQLWYLYSEGKFGYRRQRKIWLSLDQDFNKLWLKINWKKGNKWTKYPQEFIWDLTAPVGHLPLSNQLRGVRAIDSLFNHPVWKNVN